MTRVSRARLAHRKVFIVAKRKRNVLEEIAEQIGELVNDLERLINPRNKKPVRAPVPVPVRAPEPRGKRAPYR